LGPDSAQKDRQRVRRPRFEHFPKAVPKKHKIVDPDHLERLETTLETENQRQPRLEFLPRRRRQLLRNQQQLEKTVRSVEKPPSDDTRVGNQHFRAVSTHVVETLRRFQFQEMFPRFHRFLRRFDEGIFTPLLKNVFDSKTKRVILNFQP
jgi:hypothetical protein